MLSTILGQAIGNQVAFQVFLYFALAVGVFIGTLYLFRSIFNIPSFLRYQKAQIRLLEEIAKTQGVDGKTVQGIISKTQGWETTPGQSTSATKSTVAK
jgi:hypothetical protein